MYSRTQFKISSSYISISDTIHVSYQHPLKFVANLTASTDEECHLNSLTFTFENKKANDDSTYFFTISRVSDIEFALRMKGQGHQALKIDFFIPPQIQKHIGMRLWEVIDAQKAAEPSSSNEQIRERAKYCLKKFSELAAVYCDMTLDASELNPNIIDYILNTIDTLFQVEATELQKLAQLNAGMSVDERSGVRP